MKKTVIKKAIPPTLVVTAVFFLNYYLFGMENTLIGPFLTLSYLKFKEMEDYRGCMLRSLGIYMVMAVVAYMALLHPVLYVFCNGAALFWIGYFLIDEYNPLNYFPAGMALIFFQISPVSVERLPRRLLALLVSFGVVYMFLVVSGRVRKSKKSKIEQMTEEGIVISTEMLEFLKEGKHEKAREKSNFLCGLNRRISLYLYESNRSSLKKEVMENQFCDYIAFFQMMNYLASTIQEGETGDSKVQLQQMEQLLEEYREKYVERTGRENANLKSKRNGIETSITRKLYFRENPMDIRSFRLRFALRQVLVMTPCLLYGYLCPWENGYWLAISVFFMMIPVYENTFNRVSQRIRGSILGIIICLVAFAVFQDFWSRVLLMTIANFFIYCSGSYTTMVMCITCSALALNFGTDYYVTMLLQRLLYTLAGAVIALGANLWIFRIRAWRQCEYVMELLEELKEKMKAAVQQKNPVLPKEGNGQIEKLKDTEENRLVEMNRIMVKSYLLGSRMQEFNDIANQEHKREDIDKYIRTHMLYISKHMLLEYIQREA